MILRVLKILLFSAAILLLGQVEVEEETIGGHFAGFVMRVVSVGQTEINRVPALQKLGCVGPAAKGALEGVRKEAIRPQDERAMRELLK